MHEIIEVHRTQTLRTDPRKRPLDSLRHVRVFGDSPGLVNLQVRSAGPNSLAGGTTWHCYATATADLEQARAIRDALNAWIADQEA